MGIMSRHRKTSAIIVICGGRMIDTYFNHQPPKPKLCEIVGVTQASDALRQVAQRPVPLVICADAPE
jgi:hypothetical protein